MKKTICQIQTVVVFAIALTLVKAPTVAHANASLTSRNTPQSFATVSKDRYAFTMTLPRSSKSRFAKLSFSLTHLDQGDKGVPLPFNLSRTTAHTGSVNQPEKAISVQQAFLDETGTLWVEFNAPVPTDTTLSIIFNTQKPLLAGSYAYRIAAYPKSGTSAEFVGDGTFVAP